MINGRPQRAIMLDSNTRITSPVFVSILLILVGLSVYSGFFIYRSSVVIQGERYFSLFDDAMVSMRYASNIASGNGFVWNPGGERVEGVTNLLWTLYMALCHLIPISESKVPLLVQLSGSILLILTVLVVSRLAAIISSGNFFVVITSAFLTAFYYPLIYWTLRGMEVGLLSFLLSLALLLAIQAFMTNRFSRLPYIVLGVAVLTRMDMAIPFGTMLIFYVLIDKHHRVSHIRIGLLVLLVAIGIQTLWRLYYFGEWLPNTYYLKLTGFPILPRIFRGLWVTTQWLVVFVPIAFLLPSVLLLGINDRLGILLAIAGMQVLYSVYTGGDAFERLGFCNRYVTITMPSVMVLVAVTLEKLCFLIEPQTNLFRRFACFSKPLTKILAVVSVFFALNGLPFETSVLGMSLTKPLYVDYDIQKIKEALWLRKITKTDAKIAVYSAGTLPYFMHRNSIDILGKSDQYIARLPMRLPDDYQQGVGPYTKWRHFWPGHMKYDYNYSIGFLNPDVIQGLWANEIEGLPFLEKNYLKIDIGKTGGDCYLRKDSPNIIWGNVP